MSKRGNPKHLKIFRTRFFFLLSPFMCTMLLLSVDFPYYHLLHLSPHSYAFGLRKCIICCGLGSWGFRTCRLSNRSTVICLSPLPLFPVLFFCIDLVWIYYSFRYCLRFFLSQICRKDLSDVVRILLALFYYRTFGYGTQMRRWK